MKLATLCLTSCSGCHINLLDLHEALLDLLASNELVYSPVLADMKEPQECDLALVEGSVRNREDVKRIKALRASARILVPRMQPFKQLEQAPEQFRVDANSVVLY